HASIINSPRHPGRRTSRASPGSTSPPRGWVQRGSAGKIRCTVLRACSAPCPSTQPPARVYHQIPKTSRTPNQPCFPWIHFAAEGLGAERECREDPVHRAPCVLSTLSQHSAPSTRLSSNPQNIPDAEPAVLPLDPLRRRG